MDYMTSRVFIIAVGIFVTLTIVSMVIVSFFQMRQIYGVVLRTDTSIYDKFNDIYSMYDGKQSNGIGLLNAVKKYEDDVSKDVIVVYTGYEAVKEQAQTSNKREAVVLKEKMEENKNNEATTEGKFMYEDKYNVSVSKNDEGITIISFTKI